MSGMTESKLQHTEIRLWKLDSGWVTIEPARAPYNRAYIQLQFNTDALTLHRISPEEAYDIGSALLRHAKECGYNEDTGEVSSAIWPDAQSGLEDS
jgi:hypothetical protein